MRGYLQQYLSEAAARQRAAKFVGRTVAENGTGRTGVVVNAWLNEKDGAIGLYVNLGAGFSLTSDSEHWTIVKA